MSDYDIIGIGGPILDQLLMVSEAYIKSIPGEKGGMEPVDYPTLERLIEESGDLPVSVMGGSARNGLHGLTKLGQRCAMLGMIGRDEQGMRYRALLKQYHIHPLLIESDTPSATVLSLVTPDGERTMRTYQGASAELRGKHLNPAFFQNVSHVHIEGYMLYNEDLIETALFYAKEAGATTSFDLASFEIVKRFKNKIIPILSQYVDILFADAQGAAILAEEEDEERASVLIGEWCDVAVVRMGASGCWVSQGSDTIHCSAFPVKPLDMTGAGDLFASGFLYGYINGNPIDQCAHFGALTAQAVVNVIGPIIPDSQWEELRKKLHSPTFAYR